MGAADVQRLAIMLLLRQSAARWTCQRLRPASAAVHVLMAATTYRSPRRNDADHNRSSSLGPRHRGRREPYPSLGSRPDAATASRGDRHDRRIPESVWEA